MAENLTPKKYIDSNNMKQILDAVKNEIHSDDSQTLTEAEYLALPEEQKLNNSYYLYDIGVHYKNGVAYSRKKPIQLTMEEYKALGEVDPDQEYIVSANTEGILLEASDISYSNAVSNLPCTTVQGAIDKIADAINEVRQSVAPFPDYANGEDITLSTIGGVANAYEVKKDGFVNLNVGTGYTGTCVRNFYINGVLVSVITVNYNTVNIWLPVKKGDILSSNAGQVGNYYFYPIR